MMSEEWTVKWAIAHKMCFIISVGIVLTACSYTEPVEPTIQPIDEVVVGDQVEETVGREVFVFEDANISGLYDSGEKPLPGVLVSSHSNIHGNDERIVKWTSEAGQASFEVTFTHYFDLYVVPLCGYTPTTPIAQDARSNGQISFGLAPDQPREGEALVRFFLWTDENRDGQQNENELPLSQTSLQITLSEGDHVAEDVEWDDLAVTTDATGWGEINLGNSCGRLTLWPQQFEPWGFQYLKVASTDPEPVIAAQDGAFEDSFWYYVFDYDLGETVIKIGLVQSSSSDTD